MADNRPDSTETKAQALWPVVESGISPSLIRFFVLSQAIRGALMLTILASVVTAVLLFLGLFFWNSGGIKTPLLGVILLAAGALVGLITLLIAVVSVMSIPGDLRNFRDKPLVPGIVDSVKPRHVIVMIETGQAIPGAAYSLSRIQPHTLGPVPLEKGARVPCYTRTVEQYENDNVHIVHADVIACGTSDPFALQRCDERIGVKRYQLLEEALRRGALASPGFHQVLLDENLNEVGVLRSRFDGVPD